MKKDLQKEELPYCWYREYPVKTGLLTVAGIYILQWLTGIFYKPNGVTDDIQLLGYLFWSLIVIMAFAPTVVTLYLYRSNNSPVTYKDLFKRAILIGGIANCMSVIAIGTSNNAFDVTNETTIQAGWATIISLSLIISAPLNALLSLPFVKRE